MFNKKFTFVFITLVFMLSLATVCASDTNSTDDVAMSDSDDEPPLGTSDNYSTEKVDISDNDSNEYVLNGNDLKVYYKNQSSYILTLLHGEKAVSNASVNIELNGVSYNKTTDDEGKISIPITLKTGSYVISSSYNNLTSLKNKINVLPTIIAKDLVKTYNSNVKYYATFLKSNGDKLANINVKFKVNGITYTKKTNSKGVAFLSINLKVGQYTICAIHPNGNKISNIITVKHSIASSNLDKHYKSSKNFAAIFYGKDGKILKNKKVKFKVSGKIYIKKTNSKGIARLSISLKPGSYNIFSINPVTGEKVKNKIKVSKTISAKSMTVYSESTSTFDVKLYKNEKLVKNAKVYVYIKGKKKVAKTNSDGIASVKFKLSQGTYIFKSKDPYTGLTIKSTIYVKLKTIKASNVYGRENTTGQFKAILYNENGALAKKTKIEITIGEVKQIVKTDSKGVATVEFKLDKGSYDVVCKDLKTGFTVTNKIIILNESESRLYDKYGVSDDGKSILAIGRPSASGELSKYGYNFFLVEFSRVCPYCGSTELYWGIFWAACESTDVGVFPATGLKEGGSAEGHIFCANCDCDWSIFGQNHGKAGDLKVISSPVKVSKELAYLLKSGTFVRS